MSREKPRNQLQTIRQGTIALLGEREMSARELSKALRIREKEVYEHLAHVARSVASHRRKLVIQPSQCLGVRAARTLMFKNPHTGFFSKVGTSIRCPEPSFQRLLPKQVSVLTGRGREALRSSKSSLPAVGCLWPVATIHPNHETSCH